MTPEEIARWYDAFDETLARVQPSPPPPEPVSAHIERTVHALLDAVAGELRTIGTTTENATRIEKLAQAVASLSCWPNYNPMETP